MTRQELIAFLKSYYWTSSGGTRSLGSMFPGEIDAVMVAVDAYTDLRVQEVVTGMATTDPEAKSGLSNPPTPQHTHAAPYYEACDKCYLPKSPPKVKEV